MCRTPTTRKQAILARIPSAAPNKLGNTHEEEVSKPMKAPGNKRIPACITCRRSKVKCAGGIPCIRCTRLGLDTTCQRAPCKKRGRRKRAQAPSSVTDSFPSALASLADSPVTRGELHAQLNGSHNPKLDAAFSSVLLAQFCNWQLRVLQPHSTDASKRRFLLFCEFLLQVTAPTKSESLPSMDKSTSEWYEETVRAQVKAFLQAHSEWPSSLRPSTTPSSSSAVFHSEVEKSAWRVCPFGVSVIPLCPLPLVGQGPDGAWVNDTLSAMLGYPTTVLTHVMNDIRLMRHIVHPSSFSIMFGRVWDSVAAGVGSFDVPVKLLARNGTVLDTYCTWWIKYNELGEPLSFTLFFQHQHQRDSSSPSKAVQHAPPVPKSTTCVDAPNCSASTPEAYNYPPLKQVVPLGAPSSPTSSSQSTGIEDTFLDLDLAMGSDLYDYGALTLPVDFTTAPEFDVSDHLMDCLPPLEELNPPMPS